MEVPRGMQVVDLGGEGGANAAAQRREGSVSSSEDGSERMARREEIRRRSEGAEEAGRVPEREMEDGRL